MRLLNLIPLVLGSLLTTTTSAAPPAAQEETTSPYFTDLTGDTFKSTVAKGTWFIKHFSPYCKHCKEMAPAWEELAEKKSKEYAGRVNFAAVNCVANGDLCSENEVLAYPVLQWWVDGKKVDMYPPRDDRDFESMAKYVDNLLSPDADAEATPSSSKPKSPTATGPVPNPSGTVVQLTSETFTQHISLVPSKNTGAGWFVKFYVPWCSHCQHMAEAWTELARDMKGKLNIAEVNCDVEGRLCKDVKLRGYPTLIFFKGGERVEYDGLRGLGDLVSFAGKAVQAGVHDISASDFDIYEKKDEVIFLYFYDQATTSEDFEALDRTSLGLIGHAPLLKTSSETLANRFRITSFPKLIVLRDGKTSYYTALSPRDMRDHRRLLSWMKSVWLPMVPELSAANSHEVMQGRTVVLAILDRTLKDFEATKQKMKAAALEWLDVRAGEDKAEKQELREQKESKIEQAEEKGDKKAVERAKGIQVVVKPKKEVGFAWVDGVFWGRWCRGTYGVDVRETGPRIIINEQDEKRYWDINLQGKPILATTENIVETLQAVLASPPKIKPISMVGRLETMYRAIISFVRDHPMFPVGLIVAFILLSALWVRKNMKRRGGLSTPTFSLGEKRWGGENGADHGHARQSSGKTAGQSKFD